MAIGYEAVKVDNTHKRYWNIEAKDAETQNAESQMLKRRCWNTNVESQMLKRRC
jgi:hypothetical protein